MRKLARFFSRIIAWVFCFLPWQLNDLLASVLAFLWVDVFRIRRQVMRDNMRIAFPDIDESTATQWMRISVHTLARSLFDVIKIPYLTEKWINNNVVFHGLDAFKSQTEGVLIMTLHLASGDLGAAAISEKAKPLSLISKRFHNQFVDEFWFSLRTKSKTEFIDAHGSSNAFDILKALKRKRGVVFVVDQYMGKPFGIRSRFFGRETGTAYGLALFAKKTKAPVIPVYTAWGPDRRLHITFCPPIDLSDILSNDSVDQISEITNRLNIELERIIRLHPEQWMWVHRRWKVFND